MKPAKKQNWFGEEEGAVFCLCEAPSKEAAEVVHREAHGSVADEIIQVQEVVSTNSAPG